MRKRFSEDLEREDEKGSLFRVAKQLVNRNRDVVGANCVKNSDGKIEKLWWKLIEVWRAHYDVFTWDREGLTDVNSVCGPSERISVLEVDAAIGKMKQGKSGGPTGVVSEMLKAAGETGTLWMTDVCKGGARLCLTEARVPSFNGEKADLKPTITSFYMYFYIIPFFSPLKLGTRASLRHVVCHHLYAVVKDGKIPEDWSRSWMVNVYKGKGDALACGSYRGIKLLEHARKVLERVIEGRVVRKIVKIYSMEFGFMVGRGLTDAIFIVRQL